MRSRLAQLEYRARSVLHGVSAFGSSMAFYRLEKETGILSPKPAAVSTDHVLADVAPIQWWNTDILEPQGYQKFMAVAEEAKLIGGIECTCGHPSYRRESHFRIPNWPPT